MAIGYLSDIKPLEDAGVSDIEIAAHLSARTANPFLCADAKILLEENQAVVEDPVTLQRSGTLIDEYQAMTDPPTKSLTGWFISHVFGRGDQVSSNEYPRSLHVHQVISSLSPALQTLSQQIIDLGGGRPDEGTTEADVVAIRTAYEQAEADREAAEQAEAARRAIIERYWQGHNSHVAPVLDGESPTKEATIAAMRVAADEWEAEA